MFCFLGLQSIVRFINTNAAYFNTPRLEAEVEFSLTFKSQKEKNKNVIHWPRSVRIGRNCALCLSTARGPPLAEGGTQDLGHSFSQYGPPSL